MTEDEAISWIEARFGAAAVCQLGSLAQAITEENAIQNLVSRTSLSEIWSRHIVDSAQLILHAPAGWNTWLDVGTGAGFPGLVVAMLTDRYVTLVEPRGKRADFLKTIVEREKIVDRVKVFTSRVEAMPAHNHDVISARAVASIRDLFSITSNVATPSTTYILLRGTSAVAELESARCQWHGVFHVKPSLTNPGSGIVTARGVRRR